MNMYKPLSVQKLSFSLLLSLSISIFCSAQDPLSKDNKTPQTLQLTQIEINGQFIDFKRLNAPAYRQTIELGETLYGSFDSVAPHYNYPLGLKLPYKLNDLTFHFSAIDWQAPHKIKYSYRLEGLDKEWSPPRETARVDFQNIPHGQYDLKVKAIGEAGVWSEPFVYSFFIQRPWWWSWWAYLFYTVLLAMMGYTIYSFWREKKKQEAEIQHLLESYKLTDFPKAFELKKVPRESNFLKLVQTTLETHLSDENFGISELCELLNISRAQLHRKLKKLTGLSTSHYIRSLRLEIAKNILETTDLNVSEVAFKVGFSNPAYFSKVFKELFGYAPSELRM